MPPRRSDPTNPLATKHDILQALPPGGGRDLPHNGLTAGELALAMAKGYTPVDVRFLTGPVGVNATLQGIKIGTVRLDEDQMRGLEVEARLFKENGTMAPPPPPVSDAVMNLFSSFTPGKLARLLPEEQNRVATPADPVKKLTSITDPASKEVRDELLKTMRGEDE